MLPRPLRWQLTRVTTIVLMLVLSQVSARADNACTFPAPGPLTQTFSWGDLSFRYPDNWHAQKVGPQGSKVAMIGPADGISFPRDGNPYLRCGILAELLVGRKKSFSQATATVRRLMLKTNPGLIELEVSQRSLRISGREALAIETSLPKGPSAPQRALQLYVDEPRGLMHFSFVAPNPVYDSYQKVFEQIVQSIHPAENGSTGPDR